MRVLNPYPWGHAPRSRDVQDALEKATRGVLLRADGGAVASFALGDRGAFRALTLVREDEAVFDLAYERPHFLHLDGDAGRVATLRIARDGSIHFQGAQPRDMWTGFAAAAEPRAVLAWLASAGAAEPLARWDFLHGDAGAREISAFRAAMPAPLAAVWSEVAPRGPVHGDLVTKLVALLEDGLGSDAALLALLAWRGAVHAPLSLRPDEEDLARALLNRFDFDRVAGAAASLAASAGAAPSLAASAGAAPSLAASAGAAASLDTEAARAGVGRFLLDAAPLPPVLWRSVERLSEPVREGLVAALAARASEADAAALRAVLFPPPVSAPAGTTLVGRSNTVRLRRPVTDGSALLAIDGSEVVRLADGARTALFLQLGSPPVCCHGGVLFVGGGSLVDRRSAADGALLERRPGATPAERERARAEIASWAAPPPGEGLTPIAPAPEELEAYEAFACAGAPPPPAARVAGRLFLEAGGAALVRAGSPPGAAISAVAAAPALPGSPSGAARFALPGKALSVAVTAALVHVLVEVPGGVAIATLPDNSALPHAGVRAAAPDNGALPHTAVRATDPDNGALPHTAVRATAPDTGDLRVSGVLAVAPSAVAFFLASESDVFLGIDTGAGILVARRTIEALGGGSETR